MTPTSLQIPPVRKTVRVEIPPGRAFEIFIGRMGSWWLKNHTIGATPFTDVVVEPRVGGRWFERAADGAETDWGKVLVWEPPGRVVLGWQLDADWAYDPALLTELELRFIADGANATRVELEHRHLERFGDAAGALRNAFDSDGGWAGLLTAFAASTGS